MLPRACTVLLRCRVGSWAGTDLCNCDYCGIVAIVVLLLLWCCYYCGIATIVVLLLGGVQPPQTIVMPATHGDIAPFQKFVKYLKGRKRVRQK